MTDEYYAYLCGAEWALRCQQVRERANNRCEKCGSQNFLQTHHLTYARIFHEELSDLVLLCDACHIQTHKASEPSPIDWFGTQLAEERAARAYVLAVVKGRANAE